MTIVFKCGSNFIDFSNVSFTKKKKEERSDLEFVVCNNFSYMNPIKKMCFFFLSFQLILWRSATFSL